MVFFKYTIYVNMLNGCICLFLGKRGKGKKGCPPRTRNVHCVTQEEIDIDRQRCCLDKIADDEMRMKRKHRNLEVRRGFRLPYPVLRKWMMKLVHQQL